MIMLNALLRSAPFADYIAVNISSPNTPNLRSFHLEENFLPLFEALSLAREKMQYANPILIKLSPDEDENIISDNFICNSKI